MGLVIFYGADHARACALGMRINGQAAHLAKLANASRADIHAMDIELLRAAYTMAHGRVQGVDGGVHVVPVFISGAPIGVYDASAARAIDLARFKDETEVASPCTLR